MLSLHHQLRKNNGRVYSFCKKVPSDDLRFGCRTECIDHHFEECSEERQAGARLSFLRSERCGQNHLCPHFAKAINCEHPREDGEACNECESCRAFNEQRSYNIFELDAASNNGVDQIKVLMEQTRIPPQVGKYKVFIIDEVHMLSTAAFNAFLKTLEEPPQHVIFILATTEKHKILPTILSRCQIYDFERMTVANTINHLKMVLRRKAYNMKSRRSP